MSTNRLSKTRLRTTAASSALAMVVLTLASCGEPGPQAADAPSQPTSTVQRSSASTSTTFSPPTLLTLGSLVLDKGRFANQNRPDSPLGALCWSRREVVLSIVKAASEPEGTEDAADFDGRPLQEVIADVTGRIARSKVAEDAEVGVFAAHFLTALERAVRDQADAIHSDDPDLIAKVWSEYFAFEGYPGINDYLAAASSSPDCPQP